MFSTKNNKKKKLKYHLSSLIQWMVLSAMIKSYSSGP